MGAQMKNKFFDELVESIKEAGRIDRGEIEPSREFIFDAQDVRRIREKLDYRLRPSLRSLRGKAATKHRGRKR